MKNARDFRWVGLFGVPIGLLAAVLWACGPSASSGPLPQGALIVDVRTPREFEGGHYHQAQNIPLAELKDRVAELGSKNQPIVLYCRSGSRSGVALKMLRGLGYSQVINGGGLVDMQRNHGRKK